MDARARQPVALLPERLAGAELARAEHRVQMAGEQDRLAGTVFAEHADQQPGAVRRDRLDMAGKALGFERAAEPLLHLFHVFLFLVMPFHIDDSPDVA